MKPEEPVKKFRIIPDMYDRVGWEADGTPVYKPMVRPTKSYKEYLDDKYCWEIIQRWKKLRACLEDQQKRYGEADELQVQEWLHLGNLIENTPELKKWRILDELQAQGKTSRIVMTR